MDLNELRGLPPEQAIEKAAAWAGVRPEILDGIWNTESGRGTHPTMVGPDTKWGTAKGHFQQLDSTVQEWSRRAGVTLDPFDFTDGLFMAASQLRENVSRYGDEAQAVMAYHGGTNQKNWGKKTQDYLRKVTGMQEPTGDVGSSVPPGKLELPASVVDQIAQIGPVGRSAPAPETPPPAPVLEQDPAAAPVQTVQGEGDFRYNIAVASAPVAAPEFSWDTKQNAAYENSMEPWFNIARNLEDGGPTRDPAWMRWAAENDADVYKDVPAEADREFLRGAVSASDLEFRKARLAERQARDKVVGSTGPWSELGHSVLADLRNPASWTADLVATAGISKVVRLGSMTAKAARLAAVPAAAAEAVAGSLTYDAMLTMAGEYRSANDVVAGAVASAGVGGALGISAFRAASRRELREFEQRTLERALNGKLDVLQTAVDELGSQADPVDIGRRASEIEASALREEHSAALTAAPEGDRMPAAEPVPDPADVDLEANDLRAAEVGFSADLRADSNFAKPETRGIADMTAHGDAAYKMARDLGMDLPDTPDAALRVSALEAADARGGVVLHGATKDEPLYKQYSQVLSDLQRQFGMTDVTFHLTDGGTQLTSELGAHRLQSARSSIIALRPGAGYDTLVHEFGHAVFAHRLASQPLEKQAAMRGAWQEWRKLYDQPTRAQEAVLRRSAVTTQAKRPDSFSAMAATGRVEGTLRRLWDQAFPGDRKKAAKFADYYANFDEYSAEQLVKFVETEAAGLGDGKLSIPKQIFQMVADAVRWAKELFGFAKQHDLIRPEAPFKEFFESLLGGNAAKGLPAFDPTVQAMAVPVGGFKGPAMLSPQKPRISAADWALAQKYGLDLMPQTTPLERAEFKMVLGIFRKAEAWVAAHPRLDERAQTLLNKSTIFQVTGTALAASDNPVARMVAGTLLESTTGAQGRRATAAIAANMHDRRFLGNTIGAYTTAYDQWAKLNGGGFIDEFKGTTRERFDRAVALEISERGQGRSGGDPLVSRAADELEKAYERMRVAQVTTGTVGNAMLPDSSRGYMPRVLNKGKVMNMTDKELRAFVDIMSEQFQTLEGFDAKFSAELARKYVDHARVNANGGHEIPANIHQPGAADMVRKALEDMGVGHEALVDMMQRFSRGGPSHTKHRLNLDLTKDYGGVKLLDLYDVNQLELLRRYSRRVSGEVALAQFGVMGSQGLKVLRRAMEFGPDANKPELREAFDQIAAEFLGQPFGTSTGKWMDRAMQANSLARMGGMGITQAGEMVNAVWHLGVLRSLATIPALPRLRREILALRKGQAVDNPILSSIEQYGGAGEFGMDGYRMVLPYDDLNNAYHTYGKDTVTALDKVLRAGNYTQGILSGWRAIHGLQQRAVAEQITLKAVRYMRDGLESVALEDMGFTKKFQQRFVKDLNNIVTFDDAGRVKTFDLTKASDPALAQEFAQAVLRGTNQIIQGQFIGETGKWAHDGWLKMFTQFRAFPLVAMEKQWARQRANHGYLTTIGMLFGSIAAVSPLIMGRIYLSSLGRPDADAYIEERLQPANIARMALNYVALSGLSGDLLDALSSVAPEEWGLQQSGARSGGAKGAVGNIAAPALGYVDDIYKAMQDPSNPHKWAQLAPFSRLPYVLPLLNTLRPE